jgi:hypothetical protein
MKIENPTALDVTALPMMGPGSSNILTVIAKATFAFAPGKTEWASDQTPIAFGDQLYDEGDGGGIRYESDIVPFKPATDVVLSGKAYAPKNRPAEQVDVALKVGPVEKRLKVFGKRLWNFKGVLSKRYVSTDAKPFVKCPIRYSRAFGGTDQNTGEFCEQNLIGTGFYSHKTRTKIAGRPLPRIEDPRRLIRNPKDHPPPAGFGFYHRAWQPRAAYAGTFDESWRVERSPRLPENFDYRYYNGAHPDLQAKGYLRGDEPVELTNLSPEGQLQFNLPSVVPICSLQHKGKDEVDTIIMNLDTVFIEPDERTLCLVWRRCAPIDSLNDHRIASASISVKTLEQAP